MSLKMNSSPYQRSPRTTLQIMLELTAALVIVWLAAVIYYFTKDAKLGLKAILLMVVALVATAAIDAGVALMKHKKGGNLLREILDGVIYNYSFVSAIIFTLCCPVYVSYYVIIIGCFASTGIKHCFGGFGKNIFNPAIIARILTGVAFAGAFQIPENLTAILNTSATVTTQYSGLGVKWLSAALPEGFNMGTLLLGNYVGAMGETFTLLIFILGGLLVYRGVINWRSTAFYLGTVAVSALFIGFFTDGVNAFTYMMYHLCLGGLMFGAVFMITDPVTSPTSPFGKALIGVIAGLITVLIRVDGSNPEGVMFSIAIVNILSPMIDRLITGRTTDGHAKKWATIGGLIAASIVINTAISVGNVKAIENSSSVNSSEVSGTSSSSTSSIIVELSREEKLFGIAKATYTEVTLSELPTDTIISKVYVASVNGVNKAICYELSEEFFIDTHGYAGDKGTITAGVSIEITTNKILSVNVLDNSAGTGKNYSDSAVAAVKPLIENKTADELALVDIDVQFDVSTTPTGTGAIYSSKELLKVAVEASKQFLNDKPVYLFGSEATACTKFTMTNNDADILEAYTYVVDSVNYVGYLVYSSKTLEEYHQSFNPYVAVSINTSDDTVSAIKIVANGGTMSDFANKAQTFLNTQVGKSINDFIGTTGSASHPYDNSIGATTSVQGIHDLVVKACTQYSTNDKANLVGGNG